VKALKIEREPSGGLKRKVPKNTSAFREQNKKSRLGKALEKKYKNQGWEGETENTTLRRRGER